MCKFSSFSGKNPKKIKNSIGKYLKTSFFSVLAENSAKIYNILLNSIFREKFEFFAVVFLENEILYGQSFPVGDEVLSDDFVVPIGKAKIERAGDHVTIVSYSRGVEFSLEAAKQLEAIGVSAEVINLRSLRPFDFESIRQSVHKTHHLVSVETGWPFAGIGSEIAAQVMESDVFDQLDAPLLRSVRENLRKMA